MKFHIKKITLWFKNESSPRELEFFPNKVNVITGEKSTGKTTILSIIDYCLLSSRSRIVNEIINESVLWYGLSFNINSKDFLIIRKFPINEIGSNEVYFSSTGEMPKELKGNNDIKKLKTIIEQEFGIDSSLIIPYGGNKISAGSKISFRYFLLFNTLSEDTIADTKTFFDFKIHDTEKYIEALDRIFFLVIGVDDINNVLIKEKINLLENEITKIDRKKKSLNKEERLFNDKILQLLKRAQEYDLLERKLVTPDEGYELLNSLIVQFKSAEYSNNIQIVDNLNNAKRSIWRKIRSLERFNTEYDQYKKNLITDADSLLPIEYLKLNFEELIPTIEVRTFINTLEDSLQKIKLEISKKRSIATNVTAEIKILKEELASIENQLAKLPTDTKNFTTEAEKFIFIGELKSQLNFYRDQWNIIEDLPNEQDILSQINELNKILQNTMDKKKVIVGFLEASIQKYYDLTHSMGVYQNYKVFFDEREKILKLRKSTDLLATANIGSKSNYMFLHLCLFLGMHEHIMQQDHSLVPQFLVLDQPSQPYLEKLSINPVTGEIINDDDRKTIKDAFSLLNTFIQNIKDGYNNEFQIILLEHASKDYWNDPLLNNFHLVEEFRNGNALIPKEAYFSK